MLFHRRVEAHRSRLLGPEKALLNVEGEEGKTPNNLDLVQDRGQNQGECYERREQTVRAEGVLDTSPRES